MRLGPGWKFIAAGVTLCLGLSPFQTSHADCKFSTLRDLMAFTRSTYVSNPKSTPTVVSYLIRYESPQNPESHTTHFTLNLADPRFQDLVAAARKLTDHRRVEDLTDQDIQGITTQVIEDLHILDPSDPMKASPSSRLLSLQAMGGEIDLFDRIPLAYASLTVSTAINDVQRVLILAEVYMALGLTVRLRNLGPDLPSDSVPQDSAVALPRSQDLFLEIYVEHRDLLKHLSLIPGLRWFRQWPGVHTLRRVLTGVYWRLDPYTGMLTRAGFTHRGTRVIGGELNTQLDRASLTNPLARAIPKTFGFFGTENPHFEYARRVDHPEDAFLEYVNRMQTQELYHAVRQANQGDMRALDSLLIEYLSQTPFELYLQQNLHHKALSLDLRRPTNSLAQDNAEFFNALELWISEDISNHFLPTAAPEQIRHLIDQWITHRQYLSRRSTGKPHVISSENTAFYGLSKAFYQARKQAIHGGVLTMPPAHALVVLDRLANMISRPEDFGITNYQSILMPHARLLISAYLRMYSKELSGDSAIMHASTVFHLDRLAAQPETKLVLINKSDVDEWLADGALTMNRQDPSGAPLHLFGREVDLTYVGAFTQPDTTRVYIYSHR